MDEEKRLVSPEVAHLLDLLAVSIIVVGLIQPRPNMADQKIQLERLRAENEVLLEQIEKLEKEVAKREYRQGLKQRPFWIRMPSIWFNIAESEFQVAGVMDDMTKYNYVVSQLEEEMAEKVKDITSNPPIKGKYLILKRALIERLADPEHERFRQLFDEELEDRTPSQFYRHLQYLAGANVTTDKILLHLWLRRLPQHCQEILASRPEQSNLKLTELADNILEATKVSEDSKTTINFAVDNIQQSVDELSKQVVALGVTVKSQQPRSRTSSTSETRSESATPAPPAPKYCWYHATWGAEAYRCVPPCDWKNPEKKEE